MYLLKSLGLSVGLASILIWPGGRIVAQHPWWMAQEPASEISLPSTSWRLILLGKPKGLKQPLPQTEITLQFSNSKFSGSGGCNQYNGSYEAAENRLTMNRVGLTRKACSSFIMQQEAQYLSALEKAESYAITSQGELRISYPTDEGTGLMVFAPQAVPGLW